MKDQFKTRHRLSFHKDKQYKEFRAKAVELLSEYLPIGEVGRINKKSVCFDGIVKVLANYRDELWDHREELADLISEDVAYQWLKLFPGDADFMKQFIRSSKYACLCTVNLGIDGLEDMITEVTDLAFLNTYKKGGKRRLK